MDKLFKTGIITTTSIVSREIPVSEQYDLLARHTSGDYGSIGEDSVEMNNQAIGDNSDYILSIYEASNGKELWIKTEYDKSITTLYYGYED